MSLDRVEVVEAALEAALVDPAAPLGPAPRALDAGERLTASSDLTVAQAIELFDDQVTSRTLDVAARRLKAEGHGHYTISSAGHEDDAVLGARLRITDPCFLHYRSGGFMAARSRRIPGADVVRDTLLSLCASARGPGVRRPAQGLGQPGRVGGAPDLHDRVAPAEGRRGRGHHRTRCPGRRGTADPGGQHRRVLLR